MVTATDRLRELLDERRVRHTDPAEWLTYWDDTNGHVWSASEMSNGLLSVSTAGVGCLTPEQAIAATLGAGTCQNEGDPSDFLCSECGARMFTDTGETYTMIDSLGNIIEQPNYCPNCGRRVEVDE